MSTTTNTAPKIESSDLSLGDLFKDFYSVPDFQREYVWEEQNVERLLEDIYDELYLDGGHLTEGPEYFIGSIVACPDGKGTFQLIDGQQRLTTIYLTLCAIRDHLVALKESSPEVLRGQIKSVSTDPRTGDDVPRYRLSLQYEDSDGVLEKIAETPTDVTSIKKTTASVGHIVTAYQTIRQFLSANFDAQPSQAKKFFAAFMSRVKLIRIITPNLAHALKVFETISDRGVGLNAMDLLKNLLFMKTKSGEYSKLKDRWKQLIDILNGCGEKPLRFLRYYIMSRYEIDWAKGLREDEIYQWFVDHSREIGIDGAPLEFVERLTASARAYAYFLSGKSVDGFAIPYLENISAVAGAAVRQHLIPLLAAQALPRNLFADLCREIENLFFCYLITREPTKYFERSFARWASDLRAVTDEAGLKAFVEKYFKPDMTSRAKQFDFAIAELSQSRIQQYRLRYILAKLTQYVEEQAWGNPAHASLGQYLDGAVHIEHILPQNPKAEVKAAFDRPDEYSEWVARLGNLTLLEKTINGSVSNDIYAKKKPGYAQSSLLLTKSLVQKPTVGVNTQLNRAVKDLKQFDTWSSIAITERQQMLQEIARKVWMPGI